MIKFLNKVAWKLLRRSGYFKLIHRNANQYVGPTNNELDMIETEFRNQGIKILDYQPDAERFRDFASENWFPPEYHGGLHGGVWDEKLLEHWISSEKLGLTGYKPDDIYLDVAAASSPWAKSLRDRMNLNAFAIDLSPIGKNYENLEYYRIENAASTSFNDNSIKGLTLHCAYEMFQGDDDKKLIVEISRILQFGGKAIILPLYLHTHYCSYSTPEYFNRGFSDEDAVEYIEADFYGIPSSRKYDVQTLQKRVLSVIESCGLNYSISILRNKTAFGKNIYCHFILEIEKPLKY